jgi:hypothetical protein
MYDLRKKWYFFLSPLREALEVLGKNEFSWFSCRYLC